MEIVNGYPCFTCSDVDLARKNIDPSTPRLSPAVQAARDPSKAAATDGTDPSKPDGAANASASNGADVSTRVEPPRDVNDPLATGDRGTQLNILV